VSAPRVKLSDIADQVRGVTYSAGDAIDEPRSGYIPILRANNISDGQINLTELTHVPTIRVSAQQIIQKGDILVATSSGSISVVGKAAPCDLEFTAAFGAFCKVIRPRKSKVDPKFLAHYFFTDEYRRIVSHLAAGANINNLRNEHLDDLMIPLPSLPEQRRIASILDKADEIRKKRELAISKLDQLAQSVFVEMFGDPLRNSFSLPQVRLGDVCDLVNGRAFKPEEWEEAGTPIIRIQNLNDETKPFNYTTKEISDRFLVKPNDILFSWSGTPGTSFGCFRWARQQGWLNQHIFRVDLSDRVDGNFFIVHLNLMLSDLISKAHGGVGLQHVTKQMVNDTLLLMPPLRDQLEFSKAFEKIRGLSSKYSAAFKSLKDASSALASELMEMRA
jgi:type I restriction enzyme, S subunit